MKVEQLQTENNAAGGLSDLTDVLGVAVKLRCQETKLVRS
jgi:hypothetical protein